MNRKIEKKGLSVRDLATSSIFTAMFATDYAYRCCYVFSSAN